MNLFWDVKNVTKLSPNAFTKQPPGLFISTDLSVYLALNAIVAPNAVNSRKSSTLLYMAFDSSVNPELLECLEIMWLSCLLFFEHYH